MGRLSQERGRSIGRAQAGRGGREHKRDHQARKTSHKVNKNPDRSIKNRIRGVQRLLAKKDLTAKIRSEQEAKLEQLNKELHVHQYAERERKFSIMYKKVRFTERIKMTRRLERAQKALKKAEAADSADLESLQAAVQKHQDDLEYVLHFPRDEKYVSLLKDPDDPEELVRVQGERLRLRTRIKQRLADAAALTEADEGRALMVAAEQLANGGIQPHPQAVQSEKDDFFADEGTEGASVADGNKAIGDAANQAGNRKRKRAGEVQTQNASSITPKTGRDPASRRGTAHLVSRYMSGEKKKQDSFFADSDVDEANKARSSDAGLTSETNASEYESDESEHLTLVSDVARPNAHHSVLRPVPGGQQAIDEDDTFVVKKSAATRQGQSQLGDRPGSRKHPYRPTKTATPRNWVNSRGDQRPASLQHKSQSGVARKVQGSASQSAFAKSGKSLEKDAPLRKRSEGGRKRRKHK